MFKNVAYSIDKYTKSIAINELINDKSKFDFYKPFYSIIIYKRRVNRIKALTY